MQRRREKEANDHHVSFFNDVMYPNAEEERERGQ